MASASEGQVAWMREIVLYQTLMRHYGSNQIDMPASDCNELIKLCSHDLRRECFRLLKSSFKINQK